MEEIELTFLPKYLPKGVLESPSREIFDIYLPSSAAHPVLRIRKAGDRYEMTKKEPSDGNDTAYHLETTVPLTKEEFSELNLGIKGKRVRKTRYYYKENGVGYKVGVFEDRLLGLVLVDVEFKAREEKEVFRPPEWLLVDVTREEFAAGGMLCGKKYSDIENVLKSFGYDKIKSARPIPPASRRGILR